MGRTSRAAGRATGCKLDGASHACAIAVIVIPTNIVSVADMQALEAASERMGVSTDMLMENAGLACALRIRERMGGAAGRRAVVLVGPGNNGADGLVVARHLRRWGADVCCYIARGRPKEDVKMRALEPYDVRVVDAEDDTDLGVLDAVLRRCDVVVDAILGAGRYRPLSGVVRDVAIRVNHSRVARKLSVIALDLPTGVNPDTGEADAATILADETLALCCPKFGVVNFPGAGYAGRITLLDIGLPAAALERSGLRDVWVTDDAAASLLPARPLNSHKGTFGHLLIIAGSRNFVGAAYLAAQGAHRSGAGLVTLAAPESVYRFAATRLTETIHLPLPEDADGRIDVSAVENIRERIGGYSALAIGCGMGASAGAAAFLENLLLEGDQLLSLPKVIDADGLNNLSRCGDWSNRLTGPAVLTPHPGEMGTLTGLATPEIQSDRMAVAASWAKYWDQCVLLKGAHSVVASPDGRRWVLPFANPALSAGGTGDVLTGVIGGLLAQGLGPFAAAALGGYMHGTAAERVRHIRGEAGMLASDLLELLPEVMTDLRRSVRQ